MLHVDKHIVLNKPIYLGRVFHQRKCYNTIENKSKTNQSTEMRFVNKLLCRQMRTTSMIWGKF